MGLLTNKVAVVTGGTRGLGLAIAQAYAREGASVMIASRSSASVERAVALLKASGAQADGLACDIGDQAQVRALTDRTLKTFGRFDIWVNNAGLSAPYGPTIDIPSSRFEAVLRANIWGTYYGSIAAMKHFVSRDTGKLINLLGRGDKEPVPMQNAYASSKAWIRNFTLALAKEYKNSGVGVYGFNPGLVMTDMLDRVEAMEGYEERVRPLETVARMWGNPPAVPAERAVWLASSATDGRTGLEIHVLKPTVIMGGLLRELGRRLTRRPAPLSTMTVASVSVLNDDQ